MTLRTIIEKLKEYALATPNVGGVIVNDVFRNNFWEDAHYGVVAIIQREHSVGESLATYRFQLAYIDRLTDDKDNEVDVQSEGVMALSNMVNALLAEAHDVELSGEMSFSVFNERFKDECGGVLANVELVTTSPMGRCFDNKSEAQEPGGEIPNTHILFLDAEGEDLSDVDNKIFYCKKE